VRLLFVSNLYPPYDRGGYEKHCHEVATGLQARGHDAFVLTSRYGLSDPVQEGGVSRGLYLECDIEYYNPAHFFIRRWRQERYNARVLRTTIAEFQPDVVMFWGMWLLSRRLPAIAEAGDVPVAYMIEDLWPIAKDPHTYYWQLPTRRRWAQPLKSLAATPAFVLLRLEGYPPELLFKHAACGSRFLKERLSHSIRAFKDAQVILCGIDLEPFHRHRPVRGAGPTGWLRIAYLGGLVPHKGVHTAVESVARLLEIAPDLKPRLTVVGAGHPGYERRLHELTSQLGIEDRVRFTGSVPNEQVPDVLARHDILVVPSVVEEGFGRVIVEGMAAGMVVVGTATGGSAEILVDGVNGLVFPPEDAWALAECLNRLAQDPALYARLAAEGKKTSAHFDISEMTNGLERFLTEVVVTHRT
jgi:glycosyltransferase involved in cell wall biosynthesis